MCHYKTLNTILQQNVNIQTLFLFRDYRIQWIKIRSDAEITRAEQQASTSKGMQNATTYAGVGYDLSDVYLRHPGNESSSDSEGEEAEPESKFFNCSI